MSYKYFNAFSTHPIIFCLKGIAFVNGVNIGRYWTSAGPQTTLYVPALYLIPSPGVNTIIMLELEGIPEDASIALVDKPNFRGLINILRPNVPLQ